MVTRRAKNLLKPPLRPWSNPHGNAAHLITVIREIALAVVKGAFDAELEERALQSLVTNDHGLNGPI